MHCTASVRLSLYFVLFICRPLTQERKAVENANLVEMFPMTHTIADAILRSVAKRSRHTQSTQS